MQTNFLYLIVPYFNFNGKSEPEQELKFFLDQKFDDKVKIILVEAVLQQVGAAQLPNFNNIYKHITVPIRDKLWLQNNLINYGISHLPNDWEYMSWCDRDIIFCQRDWVDKTIYNLKEVDVLQPFGDCFHLDKNGSVDLEEQRMLFKPGYGKENCFLITSFCKHFKLFGPEIDYNIFRHTGHVWAAHRRFFEKTGGRLFDKAFLGAADMVLCSSIKQKESKTYSNLFKEEYQAYFEYFKNNKVNVGYCDGVILHRNHGSIKNRGYNNRYVPFTQDPDFNLNLDIEYSDNGILQISKRGQRFAQYISDYFKNR